MRVATYGRLPESPVALEVFVVALSGEIPADEIDAFLDQERAALDSHPPPNATPKGPARRVAVGGRPAVVAEHELNKLETLTYLLVVGAHEVIVRSYAVPKRPSAWQGIKEKMVATIAAR
ncbi:hypothetical protein BE21_54955 [Sorangium cellulosum]|uniref:Uncharacterized protein n=1 Tax=Sorangium cellulosum TaxID=56 RepID=A0A150TCP8_SORCE|nr:hypothetical protein BE21_54955 [Sorangium cellulosum]